MTEERLKALETLCKQATDGPWYWVELYGCGEGSIEPHICKFGVQASDADFICEARTALPELLIEVRRLHKHIRQLDDLAQFSARRSGGGDCDAVGDGGGETK